MIKALITLAILFGVYWVGNTIFSKHKEEQQKDLQAEQFERSGIGPDGLAGMPSHLAASLKTAESQGANGLKQWLQRYGSQVTDPKLADIQLDYVFALGRSNPAEAKRVFKAVKSRVPSTSPVYSRVQKLDSTFGR